MTATYNELRSVHKNMKDHTVQLMWSAGLTDDDILSQTMPSPILESGHLDCDLLGVLVFIEVSAVAHDLPWFDRYVIAHERCSLMGVSGVLVLAHNPFGEYEPGGRGFRKVWSGNMGCWMRLDVFGNSCSVRSPDGIVWGWDQDTEKIKCQ